MTRFATGTGFALVIYSLLAHARAAEVVTLTDANFDDYTTSGELWMVEFYAPWCGHCKHLAPIYEEAAVAVRGKARFGAADATVQTALKTRFDVDGFPSLFYSLDGDDWKPYELGREKDDFVGFVGRMTSPPVQELGSGKDAKRFTAADKFVFAVCDSEDGDVHGRYRSIANRLYSAKTFTSVLSEKLCATLSGGAALPALLKLEDGEEAVVAPTSALQSEAAMEQWIEDNSFQVVTLLAPSAYRRLAKTKKLLVILAADATAIADPNTQDNHLLLGLQKTAREVVRLPEDSPLANHFLFAMLDTNEWDKFAAQFLPAEQLPGLIVLNVESRLFYSDPEVDEADEIMTFLGEVLDGKVIAQRQGGSWFDWVLENTKSPLAIASVGFLIICFLLVCFGPTSAEERPKRA